MGKRTLVNVVCVVVALGVGFLLGMAKNKPVVAEPNSKESAALTTEIARLRLEGGNAQAAYKEAAAQLSAWKTARLELVPGMGATPESLSALPRRQVEVLAGSFPLALCLQVEGEPEKRLLGFAERSGQGWVVLAIDSLTFVKSKER